MSSGRTVWFPTVPEIALAEAVVKGESGLEQLTVESDVAYAAFVMYCKMGPEVRLLDVANALGKSSGLLTRWRKAYHWGARIEQWWAERQKSGGVDGRQGMEASAAWQKRREELRQEEWEAHAELLTAGREALARWRASDRVPSLTEIARMMELASKLARLAAGLPLNHTEVSGNTEMPIRVEIEAALERAYGDQLRLEDEGTIEATVLSELPPGRKDETGEGRLIDKLG